MKAIIPALFFLVLLFPSCNEAALSSEATTEISPDKTTESLISISPEQIDQAEIIIGHPVQREMPVYLSCSGHVDVPIKYQQVIHSPITGFVKNIRHLPGQSVKKGTPLACIDHPNLIRLQSDFLEAAAQHPFLEKDLKRKADLAKVEAASQKDYEAASSALAVLAAHYNGLKAELKLIGIDTDLLEETRKIQPSITLTAPVNGQIAQIEARNGQLVQPADRLFKIVETGPLHIDLEVYANDLYKIKKGQPVTAQIPGSDIPATGTVQMINPNIDLDKKTATVHVHLDPMDQPPVLGSFLFAKIQTASRSVLTVPEEVLIRAGKEAWIYQELANGFQKIAVTPGVLADGYVEISGKAVTDHTPIALKGAYYINGTD